MAIPEKFEVIIKKEKINKGKEDFYYCPQCNSALPIFQCPKCQLQISIQKTISKEEEE